METYTIAGDDLQASVRLQGAELCQLRTGAGLDLLWDGDPAGWARQAPNLFPVVGALKDGRMVHQGQTYELPQHGFARDRAWTLVRLMGHACTLRLRDDAASRKSYPFPFDLYLTFRIDGPTLGVRYELHNPANTPLFASLGAHPAFRWPLLPGLPKESHTLTFEEEEPQNLPGIDPQGLLTAALRPSPLDGHLLRLSDELFQAGALVFSPVRSRALRYAAPGGPALEVRWDGFPHLGLWMKPGADFLCIEPWKGFASPADFQGEFRDKPGVFQVGPGATASAGYSVRVLAPAEG